MCMSSCVYTWVHMHVDVEARGPHQMASSVMCHAMFHNRVPHQPTPRQSARQPAGNPGSPSVSLPQFWDDRCIWSLLTFAWHWILNSSPHTCIACTFPTESPSSPDRMLLSQHCSVDAFDTSPDASAPAWPSLDRKSQITMNS